MSRDAQYKQAINTRQWQRLRLRVMERDEWMCADCRAKGLHTAASAVHHVVPAEGIKDRGRFLQLFYSAANLVSLCNECHRQRHIGLRKGSREENLARKRAEAIEDCRLLFGEETGEETPRG